jgi:proline dehydrogenase
MGITREILLRASRSEWLARQMSRRGFARRAVRRFLPGEELSAALEAAGALRGQGIASILTLLGENVVRAEEAEEVAEHYAGVLDRVRELAYDADISVKPTQLGIDLGLDATYDRCRRLVSRAAELGRSVAIDMEDSSYVERTIELYRRLRADHDNAVICLQAYLYRTAADLAALLELEPRVRLVKGAYREPRAVAYRRKRDVDANYLKLADTLLDAAADGVGVGIFFGTHDRRIIYELIQRARRRGLPKDAIEFQLLYGIQRELQRELAEDGHRVRVLISYGNNWFPWFMRRLAERPANVLFLLRNLPGR